MLEPTARGPRYAAAACLAALVLAFYGDLTHTQALVFAGIIAVLAYDLWWLAVTVGGVIWLWPAGVMDTPLSQFTLTMLLRLAGTVLLAIWGLANVYNRTGPTLVVWAAKRTERRNMPGRQPEREE